MTQDARHATRTGRCKRCGDPFTYTRMGPEKRYCSPVCVQLARVAREKERRASEDRELEDLLGEVLREIAPDGLTDDCPARRSKATA